MVFSNLVFIFAFLPIVLLVYFLVPKVLKNFILLIFSLFFYAWGEPIYVFLMLFSILINYIFGLLIEQTKDRLKLKKTYLVISVLANLAILGYYKYSNFLIENINAVFGLDIVSEPLPLPIGISFFTFQAMSYVIDVYRKDAQVQRNIFDLALYISLFPQLVAGPIVRYNTIADQIKNRIHNVELFSDGVRQFIIGLAKKVIIANPLGEVADAIFAMNPENMSVTTAWIGIIAYSLQIYFDFSGYSDMAIGLGKMFGFKFLINFNYPYIAKSVSEFWRRWHISLSSWFRDYIYIPLGGNRKGPWKTYRNLLIVWTATGFWHGASWTFMAWGFYYGIIICIERLGFGKVLAKLWSPLQHIYVLLLVMIGWVFFRADSFSYSAEFIQTMFGLNGTELFNYTAAHYIHDYTYLFVLAVIFSIPIYPWVTSKMDQLMEAGKGKISLGIARYLAGPVVYFSLLLLVTMFLVNSTYNPFIYFRF
ncbi:MBOAT family O-acyltransferase [Ureibacillus acetophenoni]|uniref:Alginate O-acetyltransferase complex protein AlgI n=1 Tax=Ureibacillus acetophenoni TaxID=614649 RepID=A0A285TYW6_9BACL|nr:MBOAT family O-acyltransferase [Ureibacillus acetophenoni]SOC34874.1 alginate O-acetyltransferase complex protein AlgI [Ureibacillus acetophenoni]